MLRCWGDGGEKGGMKGRKKKKNEKKKEKEEKKGKQKENKTTNNLIFQKTLKQTSKTKIIYFTISTSLGYKPCLQ